MKRPIGGILIVIARKMGQVSHHTYVQAKLPYREQTHVVTLDSPPGNMSLFFSPEVT